ncbi:Aspartic peptidase domain [Pseudocohnilembus persalinus]|uniref:Aspartic peptidase domain n=1 Tax=Pseudocohnilembus persalinus TaxID=266149 RepID=A0A0V0R8L0_PSEPJ|nr:Aspartic peptidase domain [Pseudocohnilembus persalinus]|eukprot:KRX10844.1 Aspartic peptidase domain [Pseudocohnilembus persalinus]
MIQQYILAAPLVSSRQKTKGKKQEFYINQQKEDFIKDTIIKDQKKKIEKNQNIQQYQQKQDFDQKRCEYMIYNSYVCEGTCNQIDKKISIQSDQQFLHGVMVNDAMGFNKLLKDIIFIDFLVVYKQEVQIQGQKKQGNKSVVQEDQINFVKRNVQKYRKQNQQKQYQNQQLNMSDSYDQESLANLNQNKDKDNNNFEDQISENLIQDDNFVESQFVRKKQILGDIGIPNNDKNILVKMKENKVIDQLIFSIFLGDIVSQNNQQNSHIILGGISSQFEGKYHVQSNIYIKVKDDNNQIDLKYQQQKQSYQRKLDQGHGYWSFQFQDIVYQNFSLTSNFQQQQQPEEQKIQSQKQDVKSQQTSDKNQTQQIDQKNMGNNTDNKLNINNTYISHSHNKKQAQNEFQKYLKDYSKKYQVENSKQQIYEALLSTQIKGIGLSLFQIKQFQEILFNQQQISSFVDFADFNLYVEQDKIEQINNFTIVINNQHKLVVQIQNQNLDGKLEQIQTRFKGFQKIGISLNLNIIQKQKYQKIFYSQQMDYQKEFYERLNEYNNNNDISTSNLNNQNKNDNNKKLLDVKQVAQAKNQEFLEFLDYCQDQQDNELIQMDIKNEKISNQIILGLDFIKQFYMVFNLEQQYIQFYPLGYQIEKEKQVKKNKIVNDQQNQNSNNVNNNNPQNKYMFIKNESQTNVMSQREFELIFLKIILGLFGLLLMGYLIDIVSQTIQIPLQIDENLEALQCKMYLGNHLQQVLVNFDLNQNQISVKNQTYSYCQMTQKEETQNGIDIYGNDNNRGQFQNNYDDFQINQNEIKQQAQCEKSEVSQYFCQATCQNYEKNIRFYQNNKEFKGQLVNDAIGFNMDQKQVVFTNFQLLYQEMNYNQQVQKQDDNQNKNNQGYNNDKNNNKIQNQIQMELGVLLLDNMALSFDLEKQQIGIIQVDQQKWEISEDFDIFQDGFIAKSFNYFRILCQKKFGNRIKREQIRDIFDY